MYVLSVIVMFFKENPPPGSYNVDEAARKLLGRTTVASPRTRDAKKRNQSFMTSAGRFVPPRDVVVEETDPENPGEQNLAACIDYLQQLLSSCGGVSSFELLLSCPPEQTISSLLPVGLDTAAAHVAPLAEIGRVMRASDTPPVAPRKGYVIV